LDHDAFIVAFLFLMSISSQLFAVRVDDLLLNIIKDFVFKSTDESTFQGLSETIKPEINGILKLIFYFHSYLINMVMRLFYPHYNVFWSFATSQLLGWPYMVSYPPQNLC